MRDVLEFQAYAAHLRSEHRRLDAAVGEIAALLRCASLNPDEAADAPIAARLGSLRDQLADHFAEEASGGCMEEAVSRCPALSGEASRVEQEHPRLLKALNRILSYAGALEKHPMEIEDLREEFEKFAADLRKHEANENRILFEGFGAADRADEA